METLLSYMDGENSPPESCQPMGFSVPIGQVPESFPDGLVPSHHVEPVLNDSILPEPDWDKTFCGAYSTGQLDSGIDMPMDFAASGGQLSEAFPAGLVPRHHMDPALNDPTLPEPNWEKAISADLKLTDAKGGLHSQKANQDIAKIANAIRNRYEFMSISGKLAVYEPPCWRSMERGDTLCFVKKVVERLFPEEQDYLDSRQYDQIIFHLQYDHRIAHLKTLPRPAYQYLCCRDGMYHWPSRTVLPHDSSFQRFSYLNIDAASIGNRDGTHWEIFLDNITGGNPALRQRILEMLGVILSGYPSKSFFFLRGESGTGKSQFVNSIQDILGKISCIALNDILQLGERWTAGSMFGKLLCFCGDMPAAPLNSKTIGTIKQLTGDDLIRGELKYKDAFVFENTAKLLFVSNYPLQIPNRDREQALLERLVEIPFLKPVPKESQIPAFHERLYEGAGYIVGLAMEALNELDSRNGVFTPLPEAFALSVVQAPNDERSVQEFIEEHFVLEEGASCLVSEVFRMFKAYYPEVKIGAPQFSKLLYRLYPQVRPDRSKEARKYSGLRPMDFTSEDPS